MSFRSHAIFWSLCLVGLLLIIGYLGMVILPFVAGIVIAYFLNPVVDRLQGMGISRGVATFIILFCAFFFLVAVLLVVLPPFVSQVLALLTNLPRYIGSFQDLVTTEGAEYVKLIFGEASSLSQGTLASVSQDVIEWLKNLAIAVVSRGQSLISLGSLLIITPVVAFYIVVDWHAMIAAVNSVLPQKHARDIQRLGHEINVAISGFLRGQTLVCILLGVIYGVGLSVVGLNFGLVIGILTGVLSFIPYVGSITGFLVSITVATVQFWPDLWPIAGVVGVFAIGQFLEGYVLSPKLVGERVGLHPVWLIFALFSFGYAFGFLGLIVAIPMAAMVRILLLFFLDKYKKSSFFTGDHVA